MGSHARQPCRLGERRSAHCERGLGSCCGDLCRVGSAHERTDGADAAFRSRAFASGIAASTLFYASMYGVLFILPQFFQNGQNLGALAAGLRLLPWTATLLVVAPVAGGFVKRSGYGGWSSPDLSCNSWAWPGSGRSLRLNLLTFNSFRPCSSRVVGYRWPCRRPNTPC